MQKEQQSSTQLTILDARGVVVANNGAWREAGGSRLIAGAALDVGGDYLDYCAKLGRLWEGEDGATLRCLADCVREMVGEGEAARRLELRFLDDDAERRYVVQLTPVLSERRRQLVLMFDDITAAKAQRERERAVARSADLLQYEDDEQDVHEQVTRLALQSLGDVGWLDTIEEDGTLVRRVVIDGSGRAWRPARPAEGVPLIEAPTATRSVVSVGKAAVLPALTAATLPWLVREEDREALVGIGARSALILPLTAHGRAVGVLTVIRTRADAAFSDETVKVGEALAARAGAAVHNAAARVRAQRHAERSDRALGLVGREVAGSLRDIEALARAAADAASAEGGRPDGVARIRDMVATLGSRIAGLLDGAAAEDDARTLRRRPESPEALLSEALGALDEAATARRVTLTGRVHGELPAVVVDRERIVQVLTGLVEHAFRATAPGDSVHVEARREGDVARFTVRDDGRPLGAAERATLAAIDRWLDRPRRAGDRPLAQVKRIVDAHRGRFWLECSDETGTALCFTVPVADVPAAVVPA